MKKQRFEKLAKLEKELLKTEGQLEKYRNKVADYSMNSPTTQRRWRSERNWDYYGKRKFDLRGLIVDEKIRILEENGWYHWHSETHWVHSDILEYFEQLGITYFGKDHTNHQCTLDEAWRLFSEVQTPESFGN